MSNEESTRRLNQAAANLSSRWLTTLIDPDQVVELRALGVESPGGSIQVWAGVFRGDELQTLAKAALELSGCCKGVYYTLNPLKPDRFRVVAPRVQVAHGGELAKDIDVPARRWILVDFDPVRAEGFRDYSATDAEKAAAWDVVLSVRSWLGGRGWPDPIISDSGNGYHLLYRLAEDLPVSLPLGANDPIRQSLLALGARFGTSAVTIDGAVFNPARIVKFPGTLTCKGENLPDRPWRRAMILDLPAVLGRVPLEMLQELASASPSAGNGSSQPSARSSRTDTGDVIARARSYLQTIPAAQSGQRGHDRTYYAAGRLVRGFGLDDCAAFDLLREWNQTCQPPWSDEELWHKIRDQGRVPGPRGFLLNSTIPCVINNGEMSSARFRNFRMSEVQDGETMKRVRVGRSGSDMLDELQAFTGGWPRRVGEMLFVPTSESQITWITEASELFAWIDRVFGDQDRSGCEWSNDGSSLSQQQFLAYCRQNCECWDHVELYPHEPRIPGYYYHHVPPVGGRNGAALAELVAQFAPASLLDADLVKLFILTLLWGGPHRKRPIFVFESVTGSKNNGTGSGKSTVPMLASKLVGDFLSVSPRETIRDIHARLLSPKGLGIRVAIIDNLKSLRFSESDIEGLITSPIISGRQLFTGEGQRPNSMIWVITSNGPSLSTDLAFRSVIIQMTTPNYSPEWERNLLRMMTENRQEIFADIIAELQAPVEIPEGQKWTRWAEWDHDILSRSAEPSELARVILERQNAVDSDANIKEDVLDAFRQMLTEHGFDPDTDYVLIPSKIAFEKVIREYSGRKAPSQGLQWLYTMNLKNISKYSARKPFRGILWTPDNYTGFGEPQILKNRFGGV